MSKLDDIRAEIQQRIAALRPIVERKQRDLDCAVAELEAHDRAVALFVAPEGRAPKRDIGKLVLDALADKPQTVAQIAEAIEVAPSRVLHTLERLGGKVRSADGSVGVWVRTDD